MRVDEIQGPGIDKTLIKHIRSWGIEDLTEIQERAIEDGIANGLCACGSSWSTAGIGSSG